MSYKIVDYEDEFLLTYFTKIIHHIEDIFVKDRYLSLFKKPVNLEKPVRGERLTTEDEKSVIDYNIVEDLFNYHEVSFHEILWGTPLYNRAYSICMDLDMLEAFFEYTTK